LVTPLDWGLGHATRCIPIIHLLLANNFDVLIATSGAVLPLLKLEFPDLSFFELPSYKARSSVRVPLILKVFMQGPNLLFAIYKEHLLIEKITGENRIDAIISDSRFGCYSKKVKSIFVTHQLTILMPFWLKWLQGFINFLNHRLIKRFDECWVPDFSSNRITGKLTESKNLKVTFIGMRSRFKKTKQLVPKRYDLLVLLSGPEPQRSVFEDMVIKQVKEFEGTVLIVRGLPESKAVIPPQMLPQFTTVVNHLPSHDLQQAIEASEIVLSRSGYTTVMDLYFLEKKAIFVPTPGQTEQEHIAEQLEKRKIIFSVPQKDFNLRKALIEAKNYTGFVGNRGLVTNIDQTLKNLLAQF